MAGKKRILTGDRPTGPLHIGHYVGHLRDGVKLQGEYESFYVIADFAHDDHAAREAPPRCSGPHHP